MKEEGLNLFINFILNFTARKVAFTKQLIKLSCTQTTGWYWSDNQTTSAPSFWLPPSIAKRKFIIHGVYKDRTENISLLRLFGSGFMTETYILLPIRSLDAKKAVVEVHQCSMSSRKDACHQYHPNILIGLSIGPCGDSHYTGSHNHAWKYKHTFRLFFQDMMRRHIQALPLLFTSEGWFYIPSYHYWLIKCTSNELWDVLYSNMHSLYILFSFPNPSQCETIYILHTDRNPFLVHQYKNSNFSNVSLVP